MATWEEQNPEEQAARVASNWSLLVGLASVLVLTAGTLAATGLPGLMQAHATGPIEAARTIYLVPQPVAPQYVVVFGSFATRSQANIQARLVRSKGYIAGVIASEGMFRVVSHAYASTERALFWMDIFADLGLDADTMADLHDLGS